jgi:uncharacterized protein YcfL
MKSYLTALSIGVLSFTLQSCSSCNTSLEQSKQTVTTTKDNAVEVLSTTTVSTGSNDDKIIVSTIRVKRDTFVTFHRFAPQGGVTAIKVGK